MKKLFIVANWKSYKTEAETLTWLEEFMKEYQAVVKENTEVVVCPPFTALSVMKESVLNSRLTLHIGAQDISPFGEGAYTGEVNAKQLQEFCSYVIIGHSERRNYFNESDEMLEKKVQMAETSGITPIYCVQGKDTSVPNGVKIVAYEPVFAIGTGQPDTPENANEVAKQIKDSKNVPYVLYGGSVKPENITSFIAMEHIDGVLIGGASLHADAFAEMIKNA